MAYKRATAVSLLVILLLAFLPCNLFASSAHAAEETSETPVVKPYDVAVQAQSDNASAAAEILSLTNQLLLKEIDLERYYIAYRIHGSREPKSRRLRFFLMQQVAGSTALASSLINLVESGKHLSTPDDTSSGVYKASSRTGLIGCAFGGASSGLEFGTNGWIALQNKWEKQDPATACDTVIAKLREIDDLSRRRDALCQRFRGTRAFAIFAQEGLVLKGFRDWCIYEFADVYSDVRAYQPSNNVFYALDVSAYAVSYASYMYTLRAFKNDAASYPALNNAYVSDALFTVEAPATTLAYNQFYKHWWKQFATRLGEEPRDSETDVKALMTKLEELAANADDATMETVGPVASRLAVYSFWSTRYDKYIDKRMGEMRRLSRIALQSSVSGPLLGVASFSQEIGNNIGLSHYKNNPYMQNAFVFAGSTTTTVSSAASVGLSGWWFIDSVRHDREAKLRKILPAQMLEERLRTLDVLQRMLEGAKS